MTQAASTGLSGWLPCHTVEASLSGACLLTTEGHELLKGEQTALQACDGHSQCRSAADVDNKDALRSMHL